MSVFRYGYSRPMCIARYAMRYTMEKCLSVCPSVCPSHAGILSRLT